MCRHLSTGKRSAINKISQSAAGFSREENLLSLFSLKSRKKRKRREECGRVFDGV
jgi:hypothetical protein